MPDRPRFGLLRCGPLAARRLARDGAGRVAAVFANAFYVELDSGLVSIGPCDFGMGALNAASTAAPGCDWHASGLRPGMTAGLRRGHLAITDGPIFDSTAARLWQPLPANRNWTEAALRQTIRSFDALAAELAPAEGFGPLLKGCSPHDWTALVTRMAKPHVELLECWLRASLAGYPAAGGLPERAVERLLGLGPGLTPSGDDYLAGMMIALHGLGQRRPLARLSEVVQRFAPLRTTAISRAHLDAAAEGLGGEALHALLHALLAGRSAALSEILRALDGVGHSSGWDGAAGLLSVLRSRLAAENQAGGNRLARLRQGRLELGL